jgi:hypothetical protein
MSKMNGSELKISKINPWFLTGFTDAEGSFIVSIYANSAYKLQWRVTASFCINLHVKD